ncbi:class I SAM-dependent methyltransferase [Candidatus Microgenomates bacterium]|jgi:SAM-dependent methyltransferase|nr:MAG: class I SAM-dependent methyltransferase [Candidatus Microgenomates bacterium]
MTDELYEKFHSNIKLQKRIISKRSITYRDIVRVINKYKDHCVGNKALDIGCGCGALSFYLGSIGFDVTGIDISKKAVDICEQNKKMFELHGCLKFFKLNFPQENIKGRYDLIICSEVLEHIEDQKKAIRYIKNKLNKNGIVIFSLPSIKSPLHRLGLSSKHDINVGHLRRYSMDSIYNLINFSGLRTIELIETEGILKNFLFIIGFPLNKILIRLSNRFLFISSFIFFIDDMLLKFFGGSQIILVSKTK